MSHFISDAVRESSSWYMPMKGMKKLKFIAAAVSLNQNSRFHGTRRARKKELLKATCGIQFNVPNAITLLPVCVSSFFCIMSSGSAAHLGEEKNWKVRRVSRMRNGKKLNKGVADVRLNFIIKTKRVVRWKHLPKIMLEIYVFIRFRHSFADRGYNPLIHWRLCVAIHLLFIIKSFFSFSTSAVRLRAEHILTNFFSFFTVTCSMTCSSKFC